MLTAGLAMILGGCASGPLLENPLQVRTERAVPHENPLYIPQGEMAYARVWEKTLDILSDYFILSYQNRYDGRIETQPTIAPGIEQPWKPGSPDLYQRVLAFCQTIRHRAVVQITTARDGGYFIDVKVLKELEDLPRPSRAIAGDATILGNLAGDPRRQFDIVEPDVIDQNWIPIGRDSKLEQVILDRLSRMDICVPGP
jgi:hypothetical protein